MRVTTEYNSRYTKKYVLLGWTSDIKHCLDMINYIMTYRMNMMDQISLIRRLNIVVLSNSIPNDKIDLLFTHDNIIIEHGMLSLVTCPSYLFEIINYLLPKFRGTPQKIMKDFEYLGGTYIAPTNKED